MATQRSRHEYAGLSAFRLILPPVASPAGALGTLVVLEGASGSNEDLSSKCRRSLKSVVGKLTHLPALDALVHAPLAESVMKMVLEQVGRPAVAQHQQGTWLASLDAGVDVCRPRTAAVPRLGLQTCSTVHAWRCCRSARCWPTTPQGARSSCTAEG